MGSCENGIFNIYRLLCVISSNFCLINLFPMQLTFHVYFYETKFLVKSKLLFLSSFHFSFSFWSMVGGEKE